MSLLGDWVARILIDISKVGPTLSSANGEWDKYYSRIQKKDDEVTKYLQRSIYDLKGIETKNRQQAYEEYVKLNSKEKKQVEERVKSFMAASNQIAAEEKKLTAVKQAEAKKQIKEQNAIIAQNERQAKQLQAFQLQISKYATIAITVPISFLFKEGLQEYMEFTQQMQNIKAVVGATNQEMRMLTNTAITMSEKFASSPIDVAKAMFDLGQAGLEADEIYKQIGPVMTLAAAGMKDVSFTAEMVVTTLKAFNLSSDESSRVADVFASSNAKSVSSLDKLSASLKYTAGLWSSMGWSLEGLVGTLDTLYDTGVRGEKAGRLLASAINGLQRPSAGATKAIEKLLGYSSALDPAFNDITDIVKKMAEAHATTSDVVRIFGKESAEVINRLIQNYTLLDGNIAEVTGNIGESARQAAIQMDTLKGKTSILVNTFSNITKSFAATMDPALKSIVSGFTSLIKPMEKAPPLLKAIVVSFLATIAVIPPLSAAFLGLRIALMSAFGTMAAAGTAITAMLGPIGLVVAGVTALSSTYIYAKKKQQDWIDSVDSGITALSKQGKSIDTTIKNLRTLYESAGNSKEITSSLYELAAVFPKLREQLNKNANDTAAAMRVLNEEYAKLKKIEADRMKLAAYQGASDPFEDSIIKQQSEVSRLSANYASLIANTREFKATQKYFTDQGVGDLAKDFATLEKNVKSGKINVDKLAESFGEDIVTVFLKQIRDTNIELEDANKLLQMLKNKRITVSSDGVETNLKMLEQLDTMLEDASSEVRNIKFTLSLEDKKATADDVGKAVAGVIDDGIKNIILDNPISMKQLGILSDKGEVGDFYKAEFQNMKKQVDSTIKEFGGDWWDAIQKDFIAKGGSNEINFSGSINKLREDYEKMSVIEADMATMTDSTTAAYKEKAKQLADLSSKYTDLFNKEEAGLTDEQKNLRNTLLLIGVIKDEFGDVGKGDDKVIDWWDQIINKLKEYVATLKGTDKISSMTARLEELRSKSGKAFDDISEMTVAINEAFANDPELKAISGLVELNNMLELNEVNLQLMKIAMAEAVGMPVQVEKFKAQSNQLQITRDLLVQAQSLVSEGSKEWKIYEDSIQKVDLSILKLSSDFDSAKRFELNSDEFSINADRITEDINEIIYAYNNLSNQSIEAIRELISKIDPEGGLESLFDANQTKNVFTAIKALKEMSKVSRELESREKQLMKGWLDNTVTASEYEQEIKKINIAKKELGEKQESGIVLALTGAENFISSISSAVRAFDNMLETLRNGDAELSDIASSIGSSLASIGTAIALLNPTIGGIIAVAGVGIDLIGSVIGLFEEVEKPVKKAKEEIDDFARALRDASEAAENASRDSFQNLGKSLGDFINNGFEQGLAVSSEEMEKAFRKYMFQMISSSLLVTSGFQDEIAKIAEELWGKLAPNSKVAANMEAALNNLYSKFTTRSAVQEVQALINSYNGIPAEIVAAIAAEDERHRQALLNASAESKLHASTTEKQEMAYNQLVIRENMTHRKKLDKINEEEKAKKKAVLAALTTAMNQKIGAEDLASLQALIGEISRLEYELDHLEVSAIGVLSPEDMAALNEKTKKYAGMIAQLASALGISSEKIGNKLEDISNSIATGLAEAVISGSYKDFKDAVYKVIVKNVTDAIISSSMVTGRIQNLIQGVLSARLAFTSEDANSLLDEVRRIWSEVTDDSTPLGSVLMGLRDALSEFGLLDINVNPGTVVTAIPSSVRDDLIAAIQGTMDNLSASITEAGLNSNIDIVNITTAYIESMTADMISISQANLNMSGSMIFQMSNGESFETWLENWFTAYLAKSGG